MVKIEDLKPGSVMRLASGSPKMVVSGVQVSDGPPGSPSRKIPLVHVTWWSERLGILKNAFAAELLVYPRPALDPQGVPEPAEAE
jgi:uncharacterized protein YodC (DUF2158 family)